MLSRVLKRLLPRSLFGRAFLILMLPMVLVIATATHMFYSRHWESVHRNMAASVAGEIALVASEWRDATPREREAIATKTRRYLNIRVTYLPNKRLPKDDLEGSENGEAFHIELKRQISYIFRVVYDEADESYRVIVALPEGLLQAVVPEKRLASPTTYIFILWLTGTAAVLSLIAVFFLRNQIRPILKLAEAAERFGKGQESPYFKPQGATEVRRAAKAFLIMRERIRRQINARTEMLAGISHDLRTPLTRMKLELALLPESEDVESLRKDVEAMQRMVEEYLQFARGEGREEIVTLDLAEYLREIVIGYFRQGHHLETDFIEGLRVNARVGALRRCLQNLVDNALRYGSRVRLSTSEDEGGVEIRVEDDGPGIPEDRREEALQAFRRLDPSRSSRTGGVGLGLTIARDIALSHGGEMLLEDSALGGLLVKIRLPH